MSRSQGKAWRNVVLMVVGALAFGGAVAALDETPLKLTAFGVNLGADRPAAQASTVEINIDRWSTEQERQTLIDTLLAKGADNLLDVLQEMPRVGSIRTPGNLGWDLHYAYETMEQDGGRRIVLATDRPMSFRELVNRERSVDYPFTVIEIHLDENGEGEGRMSIATKVVASLDKRQILLENYSVQPVLLRNVQIQRE